MSGRAKRSGRCMRKRCRTFGRVLSVNRVMISSLRRRRRNGRGLQLRFVRNDDRSGWRLGRCVSI